MGVDVKHLKSCTGSISDVSPAEQKTTVHAGSSFKMASLNHRCFGVIFPDSIDFFSDVCKLLPSGLKKTNNTASTVFRRQKAAQTR